jgi:two-component system, OmpR family, sensor histidine kinase MtrB
LLQRGLFAPILRIRDMIARFRAGDREARVEVRGPRELREVAGELNDMAHALSQQETAQLQFVAGVAHDLRNPLQALKLTARALDSHQKLPEDRVRQLMHRTSGLVERLNRMIEDLLDRSRLQSQELLLQPTEIDARSLVQEVVELFRPTSDRHCLTVHVPETAVPAVLDATRVEQVLTNLLSNALKYSPEGGEVTITLEAGHDQFQVSVADEGLGIPAAEKDRIFEPFRRGTARHDIPGVGLGLAVSRKIVLAHGGKLEVDSVEGQGSIFRLVMPRVMTEQPAAHA